MLRSSGSSWERWVTTNGHTLIVEQSAGRGAVMHQPVDHGGGDRIVDVEDLAPFLKDAVRRDGD